MSFSSNKCLYCHGGLDEYARYMSRKIFGPVKYALCTRCLAKYLNKTDAEIFDMWDMFKDEDDKRWFGWFDRFRLTS